MNPKISIIMGIFNCQDTLDEAIKSIIGQTYDNWELVMCDDGSSDSTYAIASKYKEMLGEKLKLIKNEKNMGLNKTLNRCIEQASGEYIARMDGDDISLPHRFDKQMAFLQTNAEYGWVGALAQHFDENGDWGAYYLPECPTPHSFKKNSPFVHATVIIKKEILLAVGGYSEEKSLLRVEDYHLWVKLYIKGFKGYNIQEILYKFRDDRAAYSRRKYKYRINEFRVRWLAARELPIGLTGYISAFRPLIVGALPTWLYDILHKTNIQSSEKG